MTATLLVVTYRLRVPAAAFRAEAEAVAQRIALTPGLAWKIWGFDTGTGEGTSVYLFRDTVSVDAFAAGPVIGELRDGPAGTVTVGLASVDPDLSALTNAAAALALADPAPAAEPRSGSPTRRRPPLPPVRSSPKTRSS